MRKAIIVIAAMLGFAFMSSAQPKAIGGRLGYGLEASYQHYLGSPNFLEANAGIWGHEDIGFKVTGTYNFTFAQPKWTPRGNWAWYAGPGVTFGTSCEITTSSLELLDRLDLNTNSGSLSSFLQIYVLHSEFVTAVSTTRALLLALSLHSV